MASAIAISAPSSFPRSDHQDHRHAPLSDNFHRSQDDRCCSQRSTLHRCPTHACDSSTNSRGRIDAIKKSLQTENILKVSNTVKLRFWGALAVTVTVPGAEHVASPVEPIVAATVPVIVGDVFHDRPSTCESSRLVWLLKFSNGHFSPTAPQTLGQMFTKCPWAHLQTSYHSPRKLGPDRTLSQ
jgi:hypothetical protein